MKLYRDLETIFNLSSNITFIVLGAGGTGSFVVDTINQLSMSMPNIKYCFVADGDIIEHKNISRQRFIEQDIGKNKATVVCSRYSFNKTVKFIPYPYFVKKLPLDDRDKTFASFTTTIIDNIGISNIDPNDMTYIILDCVDNVNARKDIFEFYNSCVVDKNYIKSFYPIDDTLITNILDMAMKALSNNCFRDYVQAKVLFIDMGTDFRTGQIHICIDDFLISSILKIVLFLNVECICGCLNYIQRTEFDDSLLSKICQIESKKNTANAILDYCKQNISSAFEKNGTILAERYKPNIYEFDKLMSRYGIKVPYNFPSKMGKKSKKEIESMDKYIQYINHNTIYKSIILDNYRSLKDYLISFDIEKNYYMYSSYELLSAWLKKIDKNETREITSAEVCTDMSIQSIYINRIIADLFMFSLNEIICKINIKEVVFNNGYTTITKFDPISINNATMKALAKIEAHHQE